jgi:hypothetical protein
MCHKFYIHSIKAANYVHAKSQKVEKMVAPSSTKILCPKSCTKLTRDLVIWQSSRQQALKSNFWNAQQQ